MKRVYPFLGIYLFEFLVICLPASAETSSDTTIVISRGASWSEDFAAHEVRRYIYLRTGRLFPIKTSLEEAASRESVIVVTTKGGPLLGSIADPADAAIVKSLKAQSYWVKTFPAGSLQFKRRDLVSNHPVLLLVGGDETGTVYAAYRLAEILGIRFYLDGDVVADARSTWVVPALDIRESPLFTLRGIQPFHDFPEGPDWWNREDYLAILGQLPKLRMNFFGLHTYPEGGPNAEPTVWIGPPEELGEKSKVRFSYSSSYQNTLRGNWGYARVKTSDFAFGTDQLFPENGFGADVMRGCMPGPSSPEGCNLVFERTADMLAKAFGWAHQLGIKTCVGTETPLVIPKAVKERLWARGKNPADNSSIQELYEGMFRRIAQAYPLDYFWFWTPEGWTWSGVKEAEITATTNDLFNAIAAWRTVKPPFGLATCGWVLGPPQDRAMFDKVLPGSVSVSCINRQVGYTPVDPGFADVRGRSKWAIPWMEDDPALTSPQLWVGRMRRDAADALRYGCDGLMGIHWRTRVLGPNVAALAQAAWNLQPWVQAYKPLPPQNQPEPTFGPVGGQVASFPENPISDTQDPTLYQTVRYNLSAYHIAASNGLCRVVLRFCEPHYEAPGKRVFDVKLQGQTVITNLDILDRIGKNRALNFTFDELQVTNGWLDIDFVPRVEYPIIAALEVYGDRFTTKINCGGPAYRDYTADPVGTPAVQASFAGTMDFYVDWAEHEFGPLAGVVAAKIFEKVDCRLPIPSVWTDGPGGIKPDTRPWDQVKKDYAFVDDFSALRPRVQGKGNQARFEYWLDMFEYFRAIAKVNCAWGAYGQVMTRVKAAEGAEEQRRLARTEALPARLKLVQLTRALFDHLLATVSTTGELGTVANWNQHNLPILLTKPGEELVKILGEELPPECWPDMQYHGPTRLIVPTKRTSLAARAGLDLKVIVLSEKSPQAAAIYWRPMGMGKFNQAPLWRVARSVYSATLPSSPREDLEYYVEVETDDDTVTRFPSTAPEINQTLIVYRDRYP